MQKEIDDKINLYTIIVEIFDGGTYISQVFEKDEYSSLKKWINDIFINSEIEEFTIEDMVALKKDIFNDDYKPNKMLDRINVWSSFFTIKDKGVLINIVLTIVNE
jgi:hypothetical protein